MMMRVSSSLKVCPSFGPFTIIRIHRSGTKLLTVRRPGGIKPTPFAKGPVIQSFFVRGPTHITQTDVWVSREDTLSLFSRFGDWVSGMGVARGFKGRLVPAIWYLQDRLSFDAPLAVAVKLIHCRQPVAHMSRRTLLYE